MGAIRLVIETIIVFVLLPNFSSVQLTTSSLFANYSNLCSLTLPCDSAAFMACTSGTCQCESPSNQIYIPTQNICKSTVGGQCTLPGTNDSGDARMALGRQCIDNAVCIPIFNDPANESSLSHAECRCIRNYIENSVGACVPGIGQPCNYGPEECNPLGMIACKNGVCQCMDNVQVYDDETNRCVSPAGTHCKLDSAQLGCVKNAVCYPFYYWIPPKCILKPGYIQTPNRSCIEAEHSHHSHR